MKPLAALLLCTFVFAEATLAQNDMKPPAPELVAYAALRAVKLGGEVATVSNLTLRRDAGVFTLKSGELHFFAPVDGRVTGAVFVGEGEFSLDPPLACEQQALAIYTKSPSLTEQFTELVLRFSDATWEDVKSGGAAISQGSAHAARAAKLLDENDKLIRRTLPMNLALRTYTDIASNETKGYFTAFIKGARYEKLLYVVDPKGISLVAPEQVMLLSYGSSDGGIWASFPMRGSSTEADSRTIDILEHDITARIDGTKLIATDQMKLRVLRDGARVLTFDLFPTLRVSRVTDGAGKDLPFIQQAKEEGSDMAVLLATAAKAGETMALTFEYAGDEAIREAGKGNYILLPRSTWYPNTEFGDRALFRLNFLVPKGNTIVGVGRPEGEETQEGEMIVSKWTSDDVELAVAGFNYGKFKKKDLADKESGYTIEFYANQFVPDDIARLQQDIAEAERQGQRTMTTLAAISTTAMANAAIADAQNATRIYNAYFGKLPYSRIAMTQQPASNFGQAWPTLVYMPYTAFLDTTIRTQLMGIRGGTDTFWAYVGPHEVAHQWWGHVIGWKSYRDQWMSEGFAEFSASLYVQHVRGMEPFVKMWEDLRKQIVNATPATEGKAPYTIGPVTQGLRLTGAKTGNVYRFLVYPKGAYILHMLRMMMYDPAKGDAAFQAMIQDFIKTHYNQNVSTEDFKAAVERHMQPGMDLGGNGRLDWFFDQWVYGTDMPSYAFEYSIASEGGRQVLVAKLTQSEVRDDFRMQVPIYLDFGKGWARLGTVPMLGNTTKEFTVPLPEKPKRAAALALNDVLCREVVNRAR
jgi:hypothetical protein